MPTFSPRIAARRSSPTLVMSTPSRRTRPEVGASSPAMSPRRVDFPLPDGPVIATEWPRSTRIDVGWRIVSGPAPLVTVRDTCLNSIMGSRETGNRTATPLLQRVHEIPQRGIEMVGDDLRAFRGGVNAVRLIERRIAGHALEKERHVGHSLLVFTRQVHE